MIERETAIPKSHRHRLLYVLCSLSLLASVLLFFGLLQIDDRLDSRQRVVPTWKFETLLEDVKTVRAMVDSLDNLSWSLRWEKANKGHVNLTHVGYAPLDETFILSRPEVTQHLTGVKVSGRIGNTSAVIHTNITFRIYMTGGSNRFTIGRVSPGSSTPFSVYVPDVSLENSKEAWITCETSSIQYVF